MVYGGMGGGEVDVIKPGVVPWNGLFSVRIYIESSLRELQLPSASGTVVMEEVVIVVGVVCMCVCVCV
jgi:hypothetical protein